MYSGKNEVITKRRQYTKQARAYFEKISPECAIFKGAAHARVLIYSWDKHRWECECWMYSLFRFCSHSSAATKLLPIPEPIVVQ